MTTTVQRYCQTHCLLFFLHRMFCTIYYEPSLLIHRHSLKIKCKYKSKDLVITKVLQEVLCACYCYCQLPKSYYWYYLLLLLPASQKLLLLLLQPASQKILLLLLLLLLPTLQKLFFTKCITATACYCYCQLHKSYYCYCLLLLLPAPQKL